MLVVSVCVQSITDRTAETPPAHSSSETVSNFISFWENRKQNDDQKEEEDGFWQVVEVTGLPHQYDAGHAHRFIRLLGDMCPNVCLIHGKTIQSDDQKSATFFFSPLSLCAWTLQPPELSQHFATDTWRTCYPYYNRSIVHIFESLYCPSCHVPHTSVQHLWGYLLDRKLWHRAEQLAFTNGGKLYLHFLFHCSSSSFFLSSPHCNSSVRPESSWR